MKKFLLSFCFTGFIFSAEGQNQPLVFNFDTIEPIYFDGSPGNVWQIGQPQKTFFDSAYSFPNAIVTDTINVYPINNVSVFVIKTPTYVDSGWGGVDMYFRHKYDTDTLQDGGGIEVSGDSINWTDIHSSENLFFWNGLYSAQDSLIGFSGNSGSWQIAYCFWNFPPSPYLYIKFKFTSDNIQNNKEGWMIDSLIFQYNWGIGIIESGNNFPFTVSPNPTDGIFEVRCPMTPACRTGRDDGRLEVFDLLGEKIYTSDISHQTSVNLSSQAKGIYFVKVSDEKGHFAVKKLIKE